MLKIENILVARDFSEAVQDATRYALDLATRTGATLHTLFAEVLHGDPFDPSKEPSTVIDKIRERLKQTTEEQGVRPGQRSSRAYGGARHRRGPGDPPLRR